MSKRESIESILQTKFKPVHLEVFDESHLHSRGKETHFRVVIVAQTFASMNRVQRAQAVFQELKPLFTQGLHAITQTQYTPEEWSRAPEALKSPVCVAAKK